jgi:hypothetical protein
MIKPSKLEAVQSMILPLIYTQLVFFFYGVIDVSSSDIFDFIA